MNTLGITPNYSTTKSHNTSFQGALGEKFVQKIAKGEVVNPEEVMNAVKGTFGLKTEKVADVIESLLGKVQVLTSNNEANLKGRQIAEAKLAKVPQQLEDTKYKTELSIKEFFQEIIHKKDIELAAKDAELKAAKEYAAKYEPMAKVRSIEELGVVMPQKVITTLKEMAAHKTEASESMFKFLMTGKGQEAALAQLERQNIIQKAFTDGVINIPEVSKAVETFSREGNLHPIGEQLFYTQRLIESALYSNPKTSYLNSSAIRNQVQENAMGLLTPMCNPNRPHMSESSARAQLKSIIDNVIKCCS